MTSREIEKKRCSRRMGWRSFFQFTRCHTLYRRSCVGIANKKSIIVAIPVVQNVTPYIAELLWEFRKKSDIWETEKTIFSPSVRSIFFSQNPICHTLYHRTYMGITKKKSIILFQEYFISSVHFKIILY